jgi:PEP-CTERM motif
MNFYSKLCSLGAGLILTSAFTSASTIQLGSYGTTAPLNEFGNVNSPLVFSGGPTYDIGTGGIWSLPVPLSSWVAQAPNDCPKCGHVEPNGIYSFTTTFTMNTTNNTGGIFVMADDTTDVIFNGHLIQTLAGGANHTCQDLQPNCVVPLLVTLPGLDFLIGENTLTFDVHQTHLSGEGVDFDGFITPGRGVPTIPEPGTLLMLGTGLICSAGAMFRRLRG